MARVNFLRTAALLLTLACVSNPAPASLAGISPAVVGLPIDQVLISGNERTQERYIRRWMNIVEGQLLTIQALTRARQALRDTGLFRQISFQAERHENGELMLHLLLQERRFTLLLPRISRNGDGDIKAGFRLRMYNLQGADRTLQVLAQQEEESDGDDSEQIRLRYSLPLYAKPYELKWRLSKTIEQTEVEDFDNIETSKSISMTVARDWHVEWLPLPLTVEASIAFAEISLDRPYPDALEAVEAGQFNRFGLGLVFDDVHRERYRRYGNYYALDVAQGIAGFGSDYESTIVKLETVSFNPLNRYDNFNYRVVFAVSNNSPFAYTRYGIGGASNVRGLENIDDRGDARFFANLEYLVGYHRYPSLRHNFFIDFGNIYDNFENVDLTDLHYTVGTGIRWKIDTFVKTDLFLDYGYDIDADSGKLYGGTSLAF